MITGSHSIIYTVDADADRAFLRDVLGFPNVDAGGGWLIFGLPPSEVAFHPAEENGEHRFYLICDDVRAFVTDMQKRGRRCTPPQDQGWGVVTELTLPGGGTLGVYEPRHARPASMRAGARTARVRRAVSKVAKRPAKKGAKKVAKKRARPRAKRRR